jgi:hypothetical protein
MLKKLNFININLIEILNIIVKFINFFTTHTYFYVLMFIIQILVIIFYLLMFLFKITQNILLIQILKIIYFIHGIIGLLTIIDDYIFNNYIKIIYTCIYYLITIKLFLIIY